MKKSVGIFGGSFDPIHNAHLEVARQALLQCEMDEVWLMVSPENPLKQDRKKTPEQIRLEIAGLAVNDFIAVHPELNGKLKVSNFEFYLPRPSYTISTLRALQKEYPDYRFKWIAGGDNLRCFEKWKDGDVILRDFGIIIYPRDFNPSNDIPSGVSLLKDIPLLDMSSTKIRTLPKNTDPADLPMPPHAASRWIQYLSDNQQT